MPKISAGALWLQYNPYNPSNLTATSAPKHRFPETRDADVRPAGLRYRVAVTLITLLVSQPQAREVSELSPKAPET